MNGRRSTARFLIFIGGLSALVGWWAFAAQVTVLDPDTTRAAAVGLLAAKPLQEHAVDSLTKQLASTLPASVDATEVQRAAKAALNDPRVMTAFADAIASVHRALLSSDSGRDVVIDTSAVTNAVRDALAKADPALAKHIAPKSLNVKFATDKLPHLQPIQKAAPTVALLAAMLALLAWSAAVLWHPEPWIAVRRIGRRLIGLGVAPLLLWFVVPAVLRGLNVSAAQTIAPLATAYGKNLATPAFALVGMGIALWAGARAVGAAQIVAKHGKLGPNPLERRHPIAPAWRPHTSVSDAPTDRVDVRM